MKYEFVIKDPFIFVDKGVSYGVYNPDMYDIVEKKDYKRNKLEKRKGLYEKQNIEIDATISELAAKVLSLKNILKENEEEIVKLDKEISEM